MGEPAERPDHPHGTPPGQDPEWVPPGQGGIPPGQEDHPEDEDDEHPAHLPAEDDPVPTPQEAAEVQKEGEPGAVVVEPKLSLEDFCLTQTLRPMHEAALRRWVQRHRTPRHADLATWRAYWQEMLAHTPSM